MARIYLIVLNAQKDTFVVNMEWHCQMAFAVKGTTVLLASYLPLQQHLYVQLVTTVPLDHMYLCYVSLEAIKMLLGCQHALVVLLVFIVITPTLWYFSLRYVLKAFSVLKIPSMSHNIPVQLVLSITKGVLQDCLVANPALEVTTALYQDYHFQLAFVLLVTFAE